MNKSDGGKQRKQKDTVIPETNPASEFCGKPQAMTLPSGKPKGMQRILQERGFNVQKLRAKCSPVCPIENKDCCMAHLLSQQDDFKNQASMIEVLIREAGHECIFLPKFHCELNPIEMVIFSMYSESIAMLTTTYFSTGVGVNIVTVKLTRRPFKMQKMQQSST